LGLGQGRIEDRDCLDEAFPAGAVLELRQVYEPSDLGPALTPDLLEQDMRVRDQAARATGRESC
jgi:hypothetical protein